MNVGIIYVFPHVALHAYEPYAKRFVASYMENPPGDSPHTITAVINGGLPGPYHERLFDPLAVRFISHTNVGKDIGAFQLAAHTVPCDILLCFGTHIHFPRAGWLDHITRTYEQFGPALYGSCAFPAPMSHIRTTNFWLPPQLLVAYPNWVQDVQRYDFEHGPNSIARTVMNWGYPCYQLTWSGLYTISDWHHPANRDEALFLDQHTDRIPWP